MTSARISVDPQSLINQLLNKQVFIGVPSPREHLEKMDQRASDELSEDSKFPSFLAPPLP